MNKYIAALYNELDMKLLLTQRKIEGELTYLKVLYKDNQYRNYSIEMFYNEGEIFYKTPDNKNLLGNYNSDNILEGLKNCRKELSPNEIEKELKNIPDKSIVDSFVSRLKISIQERIANINIDGLVIIGVSVFLYPTSIVIVKYIYNRKLMRPLKFFIGESDISYTSYGNHPREFINEIDNIVKEMRLWTN